MSFISGAAQVLAHLTGMADAEQEPRKFTTSPALAVPLALQRAGLSLDQVDFLEINQAFSVVELANLRLLDLPHDKRVSPLSRFLPPPPGPFSFQTTPSPAW